MTSERVALVRGEEVPLVDGVLVKNHLPSRLEHDYKTRRQWLFLGHEVVAGETGVEMVPNASGTRRTFTYYHRDQTAALAADAAPRCCATCDLYTSSDYCPLAGDRVAAEGACEAWDLVAEETLERRRRTDDREVVCVETGETFASARRATVWATNRKIRQPATVLRAITTGRRAWGYHWRWAL